MIFSRRSEMAQSAMRLRRFYFLATRYIVLALMSLPVCHADGLLAIDNPAKRVAHDGVYLNGEVFVGNDVVPMVDLAGSWRNGYSPRSSSNIAMLYARAELGVEWSDYRLGWLQRGEIFAQANRDTADLAHQYQIQTGYSAGKTYVVDYHFAGFDADGLKLSKSVRSEFGSGWQLTSGVGVSYLRGRKLKLETWSGSVTSINAQDFNATLDQNVASSDINIYDGQAFNAPYGRLASLSGQGYSVDTGLAFRHEPTGVEIDLAVADITGQMDWRNVPSNVSDLTTATKTYDANGYVQYDPAVSRTSSYRSVSMMLEPKIRLALSAPVSGVLPSGMRVLLAVDSTRQTEFWQAGLSFYPITDWQCVVDADFRFQTISVALQHQYIHFGLRTDNLDFDRAKSLGVSVAVKLPF